MDVIRRREREELGRVPRDDSTVHTLTESRRPSVQDGGVLKRVYSILVFLKYGHSPAVESSHDRLSSRRSHHFCELIVESFFDLLHSKSDVRSSLYLIECFGLSRDPDLFRDRVLHLYRLRAKDSRYIAIRSRRGDLKLVRSGLFPDFEEIRHCVRV